MLQLRRLFKRKTLDSKVSSPTIGEAITDSRAPWERYNQAKMNVAAIQGDIQQLNDIPYMYEGKRALELAEFYDKLELAEQELESALRALTGDTNEPTIGKRLIAYAKA